MATAYIETSKAVYIVCGCMLSFNLSIKALLQLTVFGIDLFLNGPVSGPPDSHNFLLKNGSGTYASSTSRKFQK